MKQFLFAFVLATLLFACNNEKKTDNTDTTDNSEIMNVVEKQDLSEYEYICAHCQLGSHEPGNCPCGMEYEENPDFAGVLDNVDDKDHADHEHDHDEDSDHNH